MSTGLTPAVSRISFGAQDSAKLEAQITLLLENNAPSSALYFAERLYNSSQKHVKHGVLVARCHFLTGEKRRCLGILEKLGYLSDDLIKTLYETTTSNLLKDIDHLSAIVLAAQCLHDLEQHEDCVSLLDPLIGIDKFRVGEDSPRDVSLQEGLQKLSILYYLLGKSYDALENRVRATKYLQKALLLCPALVEAAQYLLDRHLLTTKQKLELLLQLADILTSYMDSCNDSLLSFYTFLFNDEAADTELEAGASGVTEAQAMVLQAERLYEHFHAESACRLARKAYNLDPFNWKALSIYVACLCEMKYKTELFYLGHELVEAYPKQALTWYTVGSYYWCCDKYEQAQKFFQRATKVDKKCTKAWLALGIVLSAQEETEHALSAFRTTCRLAPGPATMFFLARELARTSNHTLALQVLHGALDMSPNDVMVLNELGVIYMQQQRLQDAMQFLQRAAQLLLETRDLTPSAHIVFNNLGTCLRRSNRLEEALEWYDLSLSSRSGDAATHANIGFTYHLMRQLPQAIEAYHRALSLQPSLVFCSDMLTRALEDAQGLDIDEQQYAALGTQQNVLSSSMVGSSSRRGYDMNAMMEESLGSITPISTSSNRLFDSTMSSF